MKTPRLKFNVSDMRLPFIILMLSSHMLSGQQQSGDDYNDGEVGGCHSNNYFPCYEDCCRRGDMFCHRAEERCLSCSTRTAHCGNDSLVPPECLHYCYLLHNPSQFDSNDVCLPLSSVVAGTVGILVLGAILMIGAQAGCARIRRHNKWPACLRVFLGIKRIPHGCSSDAQGNKDPGAAEQPLISVKNEGPSTRDVSAGRPPINDDSSSVSSGKRSSCANNDTEPDLDDLNVTQVKEGEGEGDNEEDLEQAPGRQPPTRGGDPLHLPPTAVDAATTPSAGSRGPGQATGGPSCWGTRPSQGQGAQTDHYSATGGSCERPVVPPRTSPENAGDAGDEFGMNEGGFSPTTKGGGLTHHRRRSDIEVRRARLPHGAPLHSGNNEVRSNPQFNTMNPTIETNGGNDGLIVTTGTDNPTKLYNNTFQPNP